MKYQFHEKESYIFDLLMLPQHIHYKDEVYDKMDENYDELIPEEAKIDGREFHKILLPFKERLLPYYYEAPEDHDLVALLLMTKPIIGFDTAEEYLNSLRKLSDKEILYSVYYALDYYDSDTEEDKEKSHAIATRLLDHPEEVMGFLQQLSTGNDAKWHLFSFTTNPKGMVENLIEILLEIHPIFAKVYEPKKPLVIQKGKALAQKLLESEGDGLSEISRGIIKTSLLNREEYPILVSLCNPTNLMLNAGNIHPFICWGIYLDEIFEAIKQQEENKIVERVLLFKNLGDKTRYEVIMNLARGITSTKVIASNLNVSPATISYHLNNLATAKIIYLDQVEGRYIYKINEEFLKRAVEELKKDFML